MALSIFSLMCVFCYLHAYDYCYSKLLLLRYISQDTYVQEEEKKDAPVDASALQELSAQLPPVDSVRNIKTNIVEFEKVDIVALLLSYLTSPFYKGRRP